MGRPSGAQTSETLHPLLANTKQAKTEKSHTWRHFWLLAFQQSQVDIAFVCSSSTIATPTRIYYLQWSVHSKGQPICSSCILHRIRQRRTQYTYLIQLWKVANSCYQHPRITRRLM